MLERIKKLSWHRLLGSIATFAIFVANFSVHVPCDGNWYQPVVPDKLRRDK